jgi:hypothetical protein
VQRTAITAIAVGVTVIAVGAGVLLVIDETDGTRNSSVKPGDSPILATPSGFDQSQPLEVRLRALEQAVSDERYARQLLQDELFVLTAEIESLTASRPSDVAADQSGSLERSDRAPPGSGRRTGAEVRVARLIEAGFPPGQAEWILQRESQLQMDALQARYEAERTGDATDFLQSRTAASDALRNELGDADYERYLGASGRPTSVAVSGVLDSSPAQRAGFRPGDEIVRYDGRRIFSMTDLSRQTMEGQPGEQVVVDILRGGVSMQLVVPRGPIGISGGRRFSR